LRVGLFLESVCSCLHCISLAVSCFIGALTESLRWPARGAIFGFGSARGGIRLLTRLLRGPVASGADK
jgi:hypothetical protein